MNEIMNRALANAMRPLVELVYKLEAKLAGKPHFEWGTVVSADPLRVKLDSHATPLPDRPDSLVSGLQEGDRVRIERQGTRVTIHGSGNGSDTGWLTLSLAPGVTGSCRYRKAGNLVEVRFDIRGSITGDTPVTTALPDKYRLSPEATGLQVTPILADPAGVRSAALAYWDGGTLRATSSGAGTMTRLRGADRWMTKG